jgi:hypothetical protein
MKTLASQVINGKLHEEKNKLKDEIIANYDSVEGKEVLDQIASLGFEPKRLKSAKAFSRKIKKVVETLTKPDLTSKNVETICKDFSVPFGDRVAAGESFSQIANSLLIDFATRSGENDKVIEELSAKKEKLEALNKQYFALRKPVLKKWREDYRTLVIKGREFVSNDQKLVELKQLHKTQKGADKKVTKEQIDELEAKLHTEVSQRMTDSVEISSALSVDPLIAQRLSFIFTKRREIDELSSNEVRVAKAGEVLSALAEQLTLAMVNNIKANLRGQDPFDMKISLAELKGGDKATNPAIVLTYCSLTKSVIDSGAEPEFSENIKQFGPAVKNIIASSGMQRVKRDPGVKDALCQIVHDFAVTLSTMFKGSITGKAKTVSEAGIRQVVANYLLSHHVLDPVFDAVLDRVFAKPVRQPKA